MAGNTYLVMMLLLLSVLQTMGQEGTSLHVLYNLYIRL